MFDFQKLEVYKKAKLINKDIFKLCSRFGRFDSYRDHLTRASTSILLNIAEGTGRFSKKDRRHFYIISRGSLFECVALIEILKEEGLVTSFEYTNFETKYIELSKMLFGLIKSSED